MTEINDYYEGSGCTCCASSSNECGCEGADWTPKEVYDLRSEVMALKAFAESTANLAKALKEDLDEEKKWHHQTHAELVKAQCNTMDSKQLADKLTALELESTSELARLEQERNEARIDAQKSKAYKRVLKETNLRQTERIRYLEGATNHACGTPLSVALKERDEARENLADALQEVDLRTLDFERMKKERDEARDAIVGWENKWKCAVDMAARAELERDEALKCAKEYYVEFIRNASSDNKVSKPNPLKPFYKY
jgi:hypothetical protein